VISVVLYGRNDNYGYNLHKRAALSLNCIAAVLSGADDEILFVDYNTANDFPTFPEAIQDTLTKKVRQKLRIFRVRPFIHDRLKDKTRLVAIEPISRNVAVRRSSSKNRWILSTNTDLIFLTLAGNSLTDIVGALPRGFYAAPRVEVPEMLWEGLDRLNPELAIETVRAWGSTLHLNEIVRGVETNRYHAPGDFQLIERRDLFEYHGFNEEMVLGWHVDSNIFKRLYLVYGEVGDLGGSVLGYHCDHTRQLTPMHGDNRTENDWQCFVGNVVRPDLPEQATSWGCPDDCIEELRLNENPSAVYVKALQETIGAPLQAPPVVDFKGDKDYDPRHVLPFLANMFACSERHTSVAWSGGRRKTLRLFVEMWHKIGFNGPVLVDKEAVQRHAFASVPEARLVNQATLVTEADFFLFDFGKPEEATPSMGALPNALFSALSLSWAAMVQEEHNRLNSNKPPRRVLAINAIHNAFETLVRRDIAPVAMPFGSRITQGVVRPPPRKE
jgi:hypothetical protein